MTEPKKKPRRRVHVAKEADKLFAFLVRSVGECQAHDGRPCAGALQCAHGFSRSYHAVRWNERNAWALCQGHHLYYTHRPLEWTDWMVVRLGQKNYDDLRAKALSHDKVDLPELVEKLREQTKDL